MTEFDQQVAATIAEQEGQDLERTLELLQHQDDFGTFVEEVQRRFPDQYSSASYALYEGDPAWAAFTDDVPAEAVPMAEALQLTHGWSAHLDAPTARFTFDHVPDPTDPSDTQPATWFLPVGFVADPAVTSVEVLVGEQGCTSGAGAEGNTAEPVVEVTVTEVRIAVPTFVRRGPQACPGHPLAPLVVDLGRPIGDRVLVDVHGSIDDQYAPPESTWGDITVPPAPS